MGGGGGRERDPNTGENFGIREASLRKAQRIDNQNERGESA